MTKILNNQPFAVHSTPRHSLLFLRASLSTKLNTIYLSLSLDSSKKKLFESCIVVAPYYWLLSFCWCDPPEAYLFEAGRILFLRNICNVGLSLKRKINLESWVGESICESSLGITKSAINVTHCHS